LGFPLRSFSGRVLSFTTHGISLLRLTLKGSLEASITNLMKTKSPLSPIYFLLLVVTLAPTAIPVHGAPAKTPLKIFILAGQSNMEGHAKVSTFEHLGMDPKTAPILKEMRAADGTPRVCDEVWISYFNGSEVGSGEGHGPLTAGYGARKNSAEDGGKIGPEFTFGIYMQKQLKEPILLIKTAWGGKSLHTDFRPPSAGAYEFNDHQVEVYKKRGLDLKQVKADKVQASGHYYSLMTGHVQRVLKDIKRVYPNYDPKQGYELAGFVWFQGWNDMVDRNTYPERHLPGGYAQYSVLLADFIRDVRRDLSAPKLPFVIGVLGVGGPEKDSDPARGKGGKEGFREAMAAPALRPEFKGNVTAVLTENYWDEELGELASRWEKVKAKSRKLNKEGKLSRKEQAAVLEKYKAELYTPEETKLREGAISNAGYHYLGSAKIMAQIGKGFAEAMGRMRP
jgi:hypothetical protein